MDGTGNSSFSPQGLVTRAQAVQVLYSMSKKKNATPNATVSTNSNPSTWYTNFFISWSPFILCEFIIANKKELVYSQNAQIGSLNFVHFCRIFLLTFCGPVRYNISAAPRGLRGKSTQKKSGGISPPLSEQHCLNE